VILSSRFNGGIRFLSLLLQKRISHFALNQLALFCRIPLVSNAEIGGRSSGSFTRKRTVDLHPELQEPCISEPAVPLDEIIQYLPGGGRSDSAVSV